MPAPASSPASPFDWESLVGVRLFSYVAGIALLVAAVAFLRYSLDSGWLRPPVRMAFGLLAGLGLLAGCETRRAQAYAVTAHALTAAGIATLFTTFYASAALWHLIPSLAAFLLMALVTAAAVLLSIRRSSVYIALLGLLGGFATPLLLATGEDRPLGLFGYLALLNVGLGWVAHRRRWPALAVCTLAFTVFYQAAWVRTFFGEADFGIGLGVFLLFPVLALGVGLLARREGEEGSRILEGVTVLSLVPPVLFALHLALDAAYGAHFGLMFGFMFLVAAGLAAVALFRGPEWLHALGAGSVLLLVGAWLGRSYTPEAWPAVLGILALFAALYLAVPRIQARLRTRRPFRGAGRLAVGAAPLLMLALPALALREPAAASPGLFFGGTILLLGMASAHAVRFGEGWVFLLAALAALLSETAWSARFLAPATLPPALAAYVALGLLYLLVPVLAQRRGSPLRPEGTPLGIHDVPALAGILFLLPVAGDRALAAPPWPWLAALAALGLAQAAAGLVHRRGAPLAGYAVLGQLVLAVWVAAGGAPSGLAPFVALGLAALVLAGHVLGCRRGDRAFPWAAGLGLLGAQFVLILVRAADGRAPVPTLAFVHAILAAGLLGLARHSRRMGWTLALAAASGLVLLAWGGAVDLPRDAGPYLAVAGLLYALQLAFPLLLGETAPGGILPWAAAVAASAVFFFAARHALVLLGHGNAIGALPVAQALLLLPHLQRRRRAARRSPEALGSLALVAGAILAFVTVAVPLQLEKEWITLGWALLAAALAWLLTRVPHRGLLAWCAALFAAVFARLALNPEVFDYHPPSGNLVFNWYLYTYLVPAACCFLAARLLRGRDDALPGFPALRLSRILPAAGGVLLFLLLNIEIADAFSPGRALAFNLLNAGLAQGLCTTLGWGVYAILLLVAGVAGKSRLTRIAAILLITVTVLKAFLLDLANLTGLYRVASFVGLAACLAGVAVILQKYVLRPAGEP